MRFSLATSDAGMADFVEKSYNNNDKPWKSLRILRVNTNFIIFLPFFIIFLIFTFLHVSSFVIIFHFIFFSFLHFRFFHVLHFVFFPFSFSFSLFLVLFCG